MTKAREILKNNTTFDCKLCNKKDMKTTGFSNHINGIHVKKEKQISSLQNYYDIFINELWGNDIKKCKFCSNDTKFISIFEGYKFFCSHQCSVSTEEYKMLNLTNHKKSLLEKYGVEHSSQISGYANRVKKTKLERYGDENYVNIEKAKKTNLEKYGVEHYVQSKKIKEQIKQTSLKKYGVEHYTQNEAVKKKIKEINLERYGVDSFMKTEEFKTKSKTTSIKKYGTEFPIQNEEIKNKGKQTLIKLYGVDSSFKLKKTRDNGKNIIRKRFEKNFNSIVDLQIQLINAKKSEFKCLICDTVFIFKPLGKYVYLTSNRSTPSRFPHCSKCNPIGKQEGSSVQKEISSYILSFLDKNKIKLNDKNILKEINKELDLLIEDHNVAFEINGLYWHCDIRGKKPRIYHINKTEIAEKNNIQLIHIFEDEIINKSKIIKTKIDYLLNNTKNYNFVGARKCKIEKVSQNNYNKFYEENHLQGKVIGANFSYGLFYNHELIACITFGQQRISLGNKKQLNEYELFRFCTKSGFIVPGAASKLFSYFVKNHNPNKIISYADRRWTSTVNKNTVYQNLGFKEINKSEPNYYYLLKEDNYRKRQNRFKFRKSELSKLLSVYDPNISEWENMKNNGHDRIWDCGTIKYEWTKPI